MFRFIILLVGGGVHALYIYNVPLCRLFLFCKPPPPLQAEGGGAGPPLENSNFLNLQQNYQKQALDPLPPSPNRYPSDLPGEKKFLDPRMPPNKYMNICILSLSNHECYRGGH